MPPIWELIAEREAAAAAAAATLREQIAKLTDDLARTDTEVAELAITRRTLMKLTSDPQMATPVDETIAGPAYQQILAVFATTGGAMRAKDVCLAVGVGVTAKDTEGMRAKLKRLVTRQILTEAQPGLFALAPATLSA